jgi:hypothetical protein
VNSPGLLGVAILVTALALAGVNVGLAAIIVTLIGVQSFMPLWLGLFSLVLGIALAALAVGLWREYLRPSD